MEVMPLKKEDGGERVVKMSPWTKSFSKQFKYATVRPVPVMEGYLPGAAKNRLSINEGEISPASRRQRESSIREGTQRRESAARGESRRFSFMSSAAEFNKLLIAHGESQKPEKGSAAKRKPRANKRDRLSSGTFSNLTGKNPRQALLATYIGSSNSHCGKTMLYFTLVSGVLLFLLGFIVGMGVLPVVIDDMIKKALIVSPDGPCFSESDGGMCPGSVQSHYYLWNITNPHEYLEGSQAPELQEVGPFVYNSYEKVYNASFSTNKTMVNYDYTYFWDYSAQDSCEACQDLDSMTIYTVNSAYLTALNQAGGSETSLIMAFLPQVFGGLYDGLKYVVSAVAPNATTEEEIDQLVFAQWANCSVLSNSASTLPAYQENDPYVPEVGAWVNANLDNATFSSGVSAQVAAKLFGRQTAVDASDPFPDPLSFIGAAMMLPEAAFSMMSGLPTEQVAMLKGYFYYVINTYGKMVLTAVVGPPLGDASTGVVIKRTAKELLEGWQDPLMAAFMPGLNISYNLGFHTDLIDAIDDQMASGTLDFSHPYVFNKEAMTGQYKPSEIGELIAFEDLREIQHGNGTSRVHGRSMEPATGFRFYNFREEYNFTMFHEGIQRPITFLRDEKTSTVRKIDALHFKLDPNDMVSCATNATQCVYADSIDGAWNISTVYMTESSGTFPQWSGEGGDPAQGPHLTFNPEHRREWGVDIEPRMGVALKITMPFQYNYFVAPTDVLHQTIWKPNGTSAPDGAWIPNFYYDLQSEISAKDAIKLREGLFILKVITLTLLCGLPLGGIIMVVFSTYKLFFSLDTIEKEKLLKEKLQTRASTVKVNRESMKMAKHDLEKGIKKDPLNRHQYSFTQMTKIPKSSLH